jgi:hypothetical protein
MTYDILLEGRNGERLVDFAASDEVKDYKIKFYARTFADCSDQYNAYKVIARSRETNGIKEEYGID